MAIKVFYADMGSHVANMTRSVCIHWSHPHKVQHILMIMKALMDFDYTVTLNICDI